MVCMFGSTMLSHGLKVVAAMFGVDARTLARESLENSGPTPSAARVAVTNLAGPSIRQQNRQQARCTVRR